MNRFLNFIILLLISTNFIFSQAGSEGEWKWYILDDFESCNNWGVINGSFYKPQYYNSNPRLAIIEGGSEKLTETPKNYCLGVKVLHIGSAEGATEVFVIPLKPIEIPGVCKKISFWVNSRNKKLEIRLRVANYMNYIYDLKPEPSDLNFWGWKELVIDDVDKKVPQINPNRLDYKPIKILSFVIDNKYRFNALGSFYLYIDHLKAYCNEYKLPSYDGSKISDKW